MSAPRPLALLLVALFGATATRAQAQVVTLAPRDSAASTASPGATVTTVMRITNQSSVRATLSPHIVAPTDWSVPIGTLPFVLAGGETDSWIVSVGVPTRAPAGRYVIGVSATDSSGRQVVRDSLAVIVNSHRGVELALTGHPAYAVSGDSYRTSFLLRNRGNVPAVVSLRSTSALGGAVSVDSTRVTLAPGEARTLAIRVVTDLHGQQAQDDVVEVHAMDLSDTTVAADASARVTVVQRANTPEPLHRVASQLRLRAANASAGVSPFELIGAGALRDGGSEQLSFEMSGNAGRSSPFGERDAYRVELRAPRYTARVGDAFYQASSLTGTAQMGFGGGLDVTGGALTAGAFAQRFRYQPDAPTERGAYLTARGVDMLASPELTVSAVDRTGGVSAGRIMAAGSTLHAGAGAVMEFELASSNGPRGRGMARTARVSGGDRLHFDLGHTFGDDAFAGQQRGAEYDFGDASIAVAREWQITASTAYHRTNNFLFGLLAPQALRTSSIVVENATRFSLQYSDFARDAVAGVRQSEFQRGVLARSELVVGGTRFWGSGGAGVAQSAQFGRQTYRELTIGGTASVGASMLSLYGETSSGMLITRGAGRMTTAGGDARLQIGDGTLLTVAGFYSMMSSIPASFSQVDATLSQQLPGGSTVSLRTRLAGNAFRGDGAHQVTFLEYSMPLQMPVGRARTAGRVRGRVVNQETGRGVAGTLVRLGPQAAITDDEGRVVFAGLPAGQYRLSLAQQSSQAPTVFTGDPTVVVDSTRRVPVTFSLAIERAGVVAGTIRQMVVARTAIDAAPDSLVDAGPMSSLTVALVGARDTLYASSDANGAFAFPEVASGAWALRMVSEAAAGTRWEPAEIEVDVKPGVTQAVSVRQVPRRRAVQMIPGGSVIVTPPRTLRDND